MTDPGDDLRTATYCRRVLAVFQKADLYDCLLWSVTDGVVRFLAECSDTFWWATADAEIIEEDDLNLLDACLADLPDRESFLLPELFAARKRGLRPMRLWLHGDGRRPGEPSTESLPLFLAAGPERDPASEG